MTGFQIVVLADGFSYILHSRTTGRHCISIRKLERSRVTGKTEFIDFFRMASSMRKQNGTGSFKQALQGT